MRRVILVMASFVAVPAGLQTGLLAQQSTAAPRALVDKAIESMGGIKAQEAIRATHVRIKGKFFDYDMNSRFKGEIFTQLPKQYRLTWDSEGGPPISFVDVLNGDKAWSKQNGELEEVKGLLLVDMQHSAYVDYVATLLPLVSDGNLALASTPGKQVEGKAADGVIVRKQGMPDVKLFFDRETHYLVEVEHTRFDPAVGKDVHRQEILKDYRVVNPAESDERVLREARIGNDGPALVAFLRGQTLSTEDQKEIRALVQKLGNDTFAVREKAKADLMARGARAIPLLTHASQSTDPEVASRARECLQKLGKGPGPEILGAAVRLIAFVQTPGAFEALLDYMPVCPEENVRKDAQISLMSLASREPKSKGKLTELAKSSDPAMRKLATAILQPESGPKSQISNRLYPSGVKRAMQGMALRDGKKSLAWELSEISFYSALGDSWFAKP